jgi:adenine-specific DNA-methyltransferase
MEEQGKLEIKIEEKIKSVEDFVFEPIKGYPMLNWKGKRPFTSTNYFPAQLKEIHGEENGGWFNKIFWGDNLQVMSHLLKEFRGQVDLIYIDPPFDSKENYKKKIAVRGAQVNNDISTFEEKQYHDIWNNDEYLQFMYERLTLARELLSSNGSIYLHCDWHKSHYIRCIMDEIFGNGGIDNKGPGFRNEIIWKRTSAHSDTSFFGNVHDTIFFFTKGGSPVWNQLKIDYEDWYVERYYRYTDVDGRKFKSGDLSAYGLSGGGYNYEWKGRAGLWRCPPSTMERLDNENKIYYTENGVPRLKQYLDEMEGLPLQSLWDDIQPIVSWSTDATGYPTQKSADLVSRIISASSKPGDLVLDFFMGSGTTQSVALELGRRFIGADINLGAIQTTTKRLINLGNEIRNNPPKLSFGDDGPLPTFYTGFEVYNVNHYDVFRNPAVAKDLLIKALEVQSLPGNSIYDGEKDGRMVKIMPINRIATRADLNELITGFDYKVFEKRNEKNPGKAVEFILLVCMGHEPDLKAYLEEQLRASGYLLDVEVVDILRDKTNLEFKRDSEAEITIENNKVVIRQFYPMNLLQKLSIMKDNVKDWRELVESVMIDFNYDGAVLEPQVVDVPKGKELVKGFYPVAPTSGTIRVKITDILSESLEVTING